MGKKQKTKQEKLKETRDYIAFLEKRLASKNYKAKVSTEKYDKTKAKLDKARLVAKMLTW